MRAKKTSIAHFDKYMATMNVIMPKMAALTVRVSHAQREMADVKYSTSSRAGILLDC